MKLCTPAMRAIVLLASVPSPAKPVESGHTHPLPANVSLNLKKSFLKSYIFPRSLAVQCPVLFNPANGIVEFRSRFVGSSARYICFPGYRLVGVANMSCQLSTQDWSHSPPTCQCKNSPFRPHENF